jgi:hypothetical protein
MTELDEKETRRSIKRAFALDPQTAHMALFKHRHDVESPPAHYETQEAFHSLEPRVIFMAFRDFGKSTIVEEGVAIEAAMRRVHNVLILGENEERAKDRLRAIKHELEYNELLITAFGEQVGDTWGETKLVLANGCCIQASGRGQSLRGVKHLQWRPDMVILDDVEDEQAVSTQKGRADILRWWTSVVRPCMAKYGRVRMLATPMADGPEPEDKCLPLRLAATPEWKVAKYPIKYIGENGEWTATWPQKYNLLEIARIEKEMKNAGRVNDFAREYMCEALADEARTFPASVIPAMTAVRSAGWRPTFAAMDPARTVRATSDYTGWAVWSWDGPKLTVWESGGEKLAPDEIVNKCFELHERWGLAALGVEEDGLNDFLLQPLRLAARERGALPFLPLRAPKGKKDFISQLRPFFMANEIEFNGPSHSLLRDQLLSFPSGKDDVPNALAYAIPMRGVPRYPMFSSRHVAVDPRVATWEHWLCIAAKGEWLAGALVAVKAPRTVVVADDIMEGDPRDNLPRLAHQLGMRCDDYTLVAGPVFHDRHDLTGLRHAATRVPANLHRSGDPSKGRETITNLLRSDDDLPVRFQVCERAKWSLRAFAGGAGAQTSLFSPLQLLLEAIESLMAMYQPGALDGDEDRRYDRSKEGRRFLSASPNARGAER